MHPPAYSTDTQILECEATPSINEGGFTVEDASGTDTTDRVVIPEAGLYELIVSLYVDNSTGTRTTPHVSFTVETGGVVTTLDDEGTGYVRGTQGSQEEGAIDHTSFVELSEDARIGVVLRQEGTPNITVEGAQSFFAIVKIGGAQGPAGSAGPAGPAGPAGADGTGTGDITAVTTGGNSGLDGGSNSGSVALTFDPDNLQTHTVLDGGICFPLRTYLERVGLRLISLMGISPQTWRTLGSARVQMESILKSLRSLR